MCSVVIAQKVGAGVHNACSSYWDTKRDGLVMHKFENTSVFCIANVFFAAL